jgi:hypothetical protein
MQIVLGAATTVQAHLTQAWLAAGDDSKVQVTGKYPSPQAPGVAPASRPALARAGRGCRLEDVRPLVGADTQLTAQPGGDYPSDKPRWQSKGKAMHSASIPMDLGIDDLADGSLAQRPDEALLRIETHHRLMNTFAILGSFLQQDATRPIRFAVWRSPDQCG